MFIIRKLKNNIYMYRIEAEMYDQIMQGQTGNPLYEVEFLEDIKTRLQNGQDVVLTIDGKDAYKLLLDANTNEILKTKIC